MVSIAAKVCILIYFMDHTRISLSVFIHFFHPSMPGELSVFLRKTEKLQDHRTSLGLLARPPEFQLPGLGNGQELWEHS